jgi:hypothetical protein
LQDAEGLRLDRQHLASLREDELPIANFHIIEAKNKALVVRHKSVNPGFKKTSKPRQDLVEPRTESSLSQQAEDSQ